MRSDTRPRELILEQISEAEREKELIHPNEGSARAKRARLAGRIEGMETALTILDNEGVDIG